MLTYLCPLSRQIWDIYEDGHQLHGEEPDGTGYSNPADFAEVIGLLGPPPVDLV
jgi:hypothetical protein